jgi:hypothetical protein
VTLKMLSESNVLLFSSASSVLGLCSEARALVYDIMAPSLLLQLNHRA